MKKRKAPKCITCGKNLKRNSYRYIHKKEPYKGNMICYNKKTNPDKLDVGVTAQDVKNALEKAGLNPKEGTIVHEIDTKNPMRLDYTKLIAPMLKAIQQLSNEVNKLKNEDNRITWRS